MSAANGRRRVVITGLGGITPCGNTIDETWEGIRRDAEQIEQTGKRVTRLVHQLLAAGAQQLVNLQCIDLNGVMRDSEQALRSTLGSRVDLRLETVPGLWPVTADPDQICQVLLTLAANACEAMPDGGTLTISLPSDPSTRS